MKCFSPAKPALEFSISSSPHGACAHFALGNCHRFTRESRGGCQGQNVDGGPSSQLWEASARPASPTAAGVAGSQSLRTAPALPPRRPLPTLLVPVGWAPASPKLGADSTHSHTLTHKHTHTQVPHMHTHIVAHSHTHTVSHSRIYTHSISRTHTHTRSLIGTHTISHNINTHTHKSGHKHIHTMNTPSPPTHTHSQASTVTQAGPPGPSGQAWTCLSPSSLSPLPDPRRRSSHRQKTEK